jgi:hypothetical protein
MGLMGSSIAFNGFDLTTQSSPLGGRFTVLQGGLTGWHTVTKRRNRQERVGQAGAFPSAGQSASLPIGVHGLAVYPTAEAAATERRALLALAADNVPLTVVDAAGEGTRYVETDSLVVSPVMDRQITFDLTVTACDPLLYGPAWFGSTTMAGTSAGAGFQWPLSWPWDWGVPAGTTPGSLFVPNAGLAPYWAKLRIDGPVTNPVVGCLETGDRIGVDDPAGLIGGNVVIPSGQWLDVDTGERHVTFGANQDDVRYLTGASGLWLVIPPGGATLTFDADTADPAAKLSVFGYEGAYD